MRGHRTVVLMSRSIMVRQRVLSGGVAGLHHRVEHQSAAPGGEVDLVDVERVATALAHDVGVRLEQAYDLVRRRHALALRDTALGLVHHAA